MTREYLPALRAVFGDWAYYSCLMKLSDVAKRVSFAKEIHQNKSLSDLIQRELKEGRGNEISSYLRTQPDRFFNSLVVAVYGGDPAWHELADIVPQNSDLKVEDISKDAISSLGFLSFTGEEKLFALDGQHRLAGIQKAVGEDVNVADDEASVIFVSHKNDAAGLIRTRKLFTTLNKTARPVTKGETIALDEADVMAITARALVEEEPWFKEERILIAAQANLPAGNVKHLTTIANLYDVLGVLFSQALGGKMEDLRFRRPSDEQLIMYRGYALKYFGLLSARYEELNDFFTSKDPASVVAANRRSDGGSVLFRPVGQSIFAKLIATAARKSSLEEAIELVGKLPTNITKQPYEGLIWVNGKMDARRQALVRRLCLYQLGLMPKAAEKKLKEDLAATFEIALEKYALPPKLV